jgi:hypothetical protein
LHFVEGAALFYFSLGHRSHPLRINHPVASRHPSPEGNWLGGAAPFPSLRGVARSDGVVDWRRGKAAYGHIYSRR